jgi:hypothetical protein
MLGGQKTEQSKMMTTVQQLIEQLQRNHKPEDSIVFQYIVADHTKYSEDEFTEIAEYVMDNESFGEEMTEIFHAWITEGADVLATVAEQEGK